MGNHARPALGRAGGIMNDEPRSGADAPHDPSAFPSDRSTSSSEPSGPPHEPTASPFEPSTSPFEPSDAPIPDGYRPQSTDTDPRIDRMLFDAYRRMPAWRKAELISAAARAGEGFLIAGLRMRHPRATEPELRLRSAGLRLSRSAMIRLFGFDSSVWETTR
jgi:hypothetical protein